MSRALRRVAGAVGGAAVVLALAGAAVDGPLFPRGLAPVDVGAVADPDRWSATCAECHAAHVDEWAASRHAVAWTNGIFQREYRREPLDWCVRCHAPLATGGPSSVTGAAEEGVNCAVCHFREGRMVSSARAEDSPHDTWVVDGYAGAEACGGCHEFNFPFVDEDHVVRRYTDHPMQHTLSEFRAGAHSGREGECLGCHGNTPAGHRMPGGHDLGALQHALTLDVCRKSARALQLTVQNVGAGHNLPTGDLHRALRLRAWRSSAPTALWEHFFGRAFGPAPDAGKLVVVDTALRPLQAVTQAVDPRALAGRADEEVNVELRYIYTADEIPTDRNHPGEPTYAVVHSRRARVSEFPRCP